MMSDAEAMEFYENNAVKKVSWGRPTWELLHTLVEKVKPTSLEVVRDEVLYHIVTICTNLLCGACSDDAQKFFEKVDRYRRV